MRFRFIEEHRARFQISMMCQILQVSKAGYYAWRGRGTSPRAHQDVFLREQIVSAHRRSRSTYGSPRIHAELRAAGIHCGRKRVARLMIQANICGTVRGRSPKKSPAFSRSPFYAPNVLARDFAPQEPDCTWVADITYLPVRGHWLYLAVVIDLFSRKVVGWATALDQGSTLATQALKMALRNRKPKSGLIHHSDRGTQYTAESYRSILAQQAIVASMSRTRECWDNAVAESFFGSLKAELVPRSGWRDRETAELAIGDYIEIFYNHQRRHSYNGYISPANAERGDQRVA